MEIGESFVGSGANAAHINTVLGEREGPVGQAWSTALATPRSGHVAFITVLQPGLPVQPPTLFVNKAAITGDDHARLTWGAAQAGVAAGVADAVADGTIASDQTASLVLIVAVWVDPAADDAEQVCSNNRTAVAHALRAGRDGAPAVDDVLARRNDAWNPFHGSPGPG